LMANPLLKEPLKAEHIKPRLLGHWGTSPGLNLIYVHLNRLINKYDLDVVYMAGPGHRGPRSSPMCILKVLTLSIFPISLRTSKECSAVTAQSGQWVPGPGAEFFNVVRKELGTLPFIAEDLGLITPHVYGLRDQFQLPGMRILLLHSTAMRITRTCLIITSRTRLYIPVPTTTTQLAAGLRHCRRIRSGTCGII